MSSLKEIKGRIASVRSTLKITTAMKMVSSAKLHRAQQMTGNMLPYQSKLGEILEDLLATGVDISAATAKSDSKRVAIVAFSSNSSLCGGYNANAIRNLNNFLSDLYEKGLGKGDIDLYTVGKKINEAARKTGCTIKKEMSTLVDNPKYEDAAALAQSLIDSFNNQEVGRVVLLYNHYQSNSAQPPMVEEYLPMKYSAPQEKPVVPEGELPPLTDEIKPLEDKTIIEPDPAEVVAALLPKVMLLKIYTVLLDTYAAEHAARTLAMQIASDNANDLLEALNLEYNKSRQQAITNELLDIVGGSFS
jgi:ATP synthase, F1 gamma subunit